MMTYAIGRYFAAKAWRDSLVLLLLGWHTYARSGELFGAAAQDIQIDPRTGMGVWRLPLTKGGQR